MYRYTLKKHWLHGARPYYRGSSSWHMPLGDEMVKAGWPTAYTARWHALHRAHTVDFYSKKKVQEVPVCGYLIPVHFFNEECLS